MKRRDLLKVGVVAGGSTALGLAQANQTQQWEQSYAGNPNEPILSPGQPDQDYHPVETPNGISLPWKVVNGVKVYHLVAEEIWHEFTPGMKAKCWGYNGYGQLGIGNTNQSRSHEILYNLSFTSF